jgi:FlaA1/EpsC-like NDP-sugar epimerase
LAENGTLHGKQVLGPMRKLAALVEELDLQKIIIAMPTAKPAVIKRLVEQINILGIDHDILPSVAQLLHRQVTVSHLRRVDPEDLLGREAVALDHEGIKALIKGRVVMVTGAGGSIGSELCRQIAEQNPAKLILVERNEPSLFAIEQELKEDGAGSEVIPVVADVGDVSRFQTILSQQNTDLIFHAAAHKHVPLMEQQVEEALTNNALKTIRLADVAAQAGVKDFVMISTDKAINPTSVMGASKRIAEIGLQVVQKSHPSMRISSVRFGNVLGSSGSVIPTFRRQITAGGPVTVTHPEVTRYFMSVAEAAGLVLAAGRLGKGGEIFILDMGEPVKIEDMARQLIELSGFEPGREIEIRYTGLRPGEKLYEELCHDEEVTEKTEHPKILRLKIKNSDLRQKEEIESLIQSVIQEAANGNITQAKQKIRQMVPEYTPWLG